MFNKSGWLIVNICFSCALYIYISIRESVAGFVMGVPPVIQSSPVVSIRLVMVHDLEDWGYPHDFENLHVFITKKIEMWICWNDYPLILLWTIYSVSIWVLILRVYPQNIASSEGKIMINQWIYIEYPVFRQTHRISSNDNKTMNLLKKLENDRVFSINRMSVLHYSRKWSTYIESIHMYIYICSIYHIYICSIYHIYIYI